MNYQERIMGAIKKTLTKSNDIFFDYIWRKAVNNALIDNTKHSKLVSWIDKEIALRQEIIVPIFNPADKDEAYTKSSFNTYKTAIGELAFLIHAKETLTDNQCTAGQRDNVEYAVCKVFNIRWNANLNEYV